jgi:hypothetical protein
MRATPFERRRAISKSLNGLNDSTEDVAVAESVAPKHSDGGVGNDKRKRFDFFDTCGALTMLRSRTSRQAYGDGGWVANPETPALSYWPFITL